MSSVIDDFNNGMKAYKNDEFANAAEFFEKAVQNHPANPRYLSYAGLLKVLADIDPEEGFDYMMAALELSPKRGEFYFNLFLAYKHTGNLKKAFDYLMEGEKQDPANKDINKAFNQHGRRKPPVFQSLDRDHFLNLHLGKIFAKLGLR